MIKTTNYLRDYCRLPGRTDIDCYVLINGRKITRKDIESLKVTYSLGNDNIPSIGNACSATLNITLYRRGDTPNYLYQDRTIIPYIGFNVFNGRVWKYEYIKLGTFYIPNSDNVTKNDTKISLLCFDNMARMGDDNRKRVQIDNNKPEIPTGTVSSVCHYLARKAGINFDYSSIEDDVLITVSPAGKNVRQVLQELAFIQGKNVIVDRDDRFKFIRPKEVEYKDFNIKANNITSLNWAADIYSNIGALQCEQLNYTRFDDEVDADTHTYEIINGDKIEYDPDDYDSYDVLQNSQITGIGFHTSIITDEQDLLNVYNRCMPYSYYKYEMTTQGFPQIEIGDIITITTQSGDERDLLIASHEITYDGGCISKFAAAGKDSEYLAVEDIKWWDLVTKTDATEEENPDKITDVGFNSGSDLQMDFNYNYLETNVYHQNGKVDKNSLYANDLIKFTGDDDGNLTKIDVGHLSQDYNTGKWNIYDIETFKVGIGSGNGCNCDCEAKFKELEKRIKYLEQCCEEIHNPDITYYNLTINYIYSDNSTAAPSYTERLKDGDSYSVKSPTIDGYDPDKSNVAGTITNDTTITVIYSKASNRPNLTNVYLTSTGGNTRYVYPDDSSSRTEGCPYQFNAYFASNEKPGNSQATTAILPNTHEIVDNGSSLTNRRVSIYFQSIYGYNKRLFTATVDSTIPYSELSNMRKVLVTEQVRDEFPISIKQGDIYQTMYCQYFNNDNATSMNAFTSENIGSNTKYGSSNNSSNIFVNVLTGIKDGYITLAVYYMDNNYTMHLNKYLHFSDEVCQLVNNFDYSIYAATKNQFNTNVEINYNPDYSAVTNNNLVIPTFAQFKYKDYNSTVAEPLVSSFTWGLIDNVLAFGKITGVTNNNYVNINFSKGILFKKAYFTKFTLGG